MLNKQTPSMSLAARSANACMKIDPGRCGGVPIQSTDLANALRPFAVGWRLLSFIGTHRHAAELLPHPIIWDACGEGAAQSSANASGSNCSLLRALSHQCTCRRRAMSAIQHPRTHTTVLDTYFV